MMMAIATIPAAARKGSEDPTQIPPTSRFCANKVEQPDGEHKRGSPQDLLPYCSGQATVQHVVRQERAVRGQLSKLIKRS